VGDEAVMWVTRQWTLSGEAVDGWRGSGWWVTRQWTVGDQAWWVTRQWMVGGVGIIHNLETGIIL